MADQKETIYLENTSNTTNTTPKTDQFPKESEKSVDELKPEEEKMSIDSKSLQDEGKVSGEIDGELKTEISEIEDGPPPAIQMNNVEYGESSAKLSIKKEMIDNEESGGNSAKHSLEYETPIYYNTFVSDDHQQPTTINETHAGEMWMCNFGTLENTANSRKRNQNQNEGMDNEQFCLKKIKIEDTSDYQFDEMWKTLEYDFSNFNLWVDILDLADYQNIENARMVYSTFLQMFPLCYGYWKKYANFEKMNNNINEFEAVLENGLNAIPISVDLWIYYMTYLRTEHYDEVHLIRDNFERSLELCGLDYHSDQLWHDYISWELERDELFNAAQIYYRLICIPTSNYLKNFFEFQEFINKQLPEQYLEFEDYVKRRNIIIESLETNHNIKLSYDDSIPPGEDFHQKTEFTEDHITSVLRVEILSEWHHIHLKTAEEFNSRKIFEDNIRRPHFHVNELDSAEIENWDNFIQFERRAGNHKRIIYLFERCLITCVSNEAFWLNYLEYLFFVKDDTDLISDVFNRSLLHHPKSLQLNLKYIDFCEAKGWVDKADAAITQLETIHPDSTEVCIKIINLARKKKDSTLGNLYKHYLNYSQSKTFSIYIAVKYARFVWKHDRQLELAFDILNDTIRNKDIKVNDSLEIYLTLVELKMELNPTDHVSVFDTIDGIILNCNSNNQKLKFSKKKLEYAEDYIQDYDVFLKAKMEYELLKNACSKQRRQPSTYTM